MTRRRRKEKNSLRNISDASCVMDDAVLELEPSMMSLSCYRLYHGSAPPTAHFVRIHPCPQRAKHANAKSILQPPFLYHISLLVRQYYKV